MYSEAQIATWGTNLRGHSLEQFATIQYDRSLYQTKKNITACLVCLRGGVTTWMTTQNRIICLFVFFQNHLPAVWQHGVRYPQRRHYKYPPCRDDELLFHFYLKASATTTSSRSYLFRNILPLWPLFFCFTVCVCVWVSVVVQHFKWLWRHIWKKHQPETHNEAVKRVPCW